MLLYDLLLGIGDFRLHGTTGNTEITSPFTDSRESVSGGLFICIKGKSFDGHEFVKDALMRSRSCLSE